MTAPIVPPARQTTDDRLAQIISDAEITRVHGHANFGAMTPREVVNDGVRKYMVGYQGGQTQLCILLEHGLITKPRPGRYDANLTKKGKAYARALLAAPKPSFQDRVASWMLTCFGPEIAADRLERGDRFLEEALELLQSGAYPRDRILALVDYVYGRPAGEPRQEVGGVMVTLAAYCLAHDLDMHDAAESELTRILQPEIVEKIRAKQAAKPTGSALPVAAPVLAPGSGHTHTAMMDALFGELMRQWPEAFDEDEGNSTIAIPAAGGFVKLDVSSLAEVVLPMVAASPSPVDPSPATDCPGTDLSIERIKGWLARNPHGGTEALHPDDLRALLNIALRKTGATE